MKDKIAFIIAFLLVGAIILVPFWWMVIIIWKISLALYANHTGMIVMLVLMVGLLTIGYISMSITEYLKKFDNAPEPE